jgi:ABC-2 type transport system ATP-binding protein
MVDGEDSLALFVANGAASIVEIVRRLDSAGISVGTISVARPSLDDVFLEATGRRLAVDESGGEDGEGAGS